jgi:hypothetical protein
LNDRLAIDAGAVVHAQNQAAATRDDLHRPATDIAELPLLGSSAGVRLLFDGGRRTRYSQNLPAVVVDQLVVAVIRRLQPPLLARGTGGTLLLLDPDAVRGVRPSHVQRVAAVHRDQLVVGGGVHRHRLRVVTHEQQIGTDKRRHGQCQCDHRPAPVALAFARNGATAPAHAPAAGGLGLTHNSTPCVCRASHTAQGGATPPEHAAVRIGQPGVRSSSALPASCRRSLKRLPPAPGLC